MYLTKLLLDARAAQREMLNDDYAVHRLVYSLFPLARKAENPRILYADKCNVRGRREILILSQLAPEGPEHLTMSSIVIPEHYLDAARFHFEVMLNPVKKDPASGKRVPVCGQLGALEWFLARTDKWGFSVDRATLEASICRSRSFEHGGREYRFNEVVFRGTLTVTDRKHFEDAFRNGIGHGKAFGFGLLQLRPARTTE